MTGKGDNIDKARIAELRKQITAAKGVIERRYTAILLAERDRRVAREQIRQAQNEIEALGGKVRR